MGLFLNCIDLMLYFVVDFYGCFNAAIGRLYIYFIYIKYDVDYFGKSDYFFLSRRGKGVLSRKANQKKKKKEERFILFFLSYSSI